MVDFPLFTDNFNVSQSDINKLVNEINAVRRSIPTGGGGTVTSVNAAGGTTGLTFTGGPVTGSGTLTLAGLLAPTNGGTGVNNGANTLTVGAAASVSGANTGDQPLFKTIAVAGQSDVIADTTTDTLTLVAGTNVTITTNAGTDSITINATDTGATELDELSDCIVDYPNENMFLGQNSGATTTTGAGNFGAGTGTFTNLQDGNGNTAVGDIALAAVIGGSSNTAVGSGSGSILTTGGDNTCIGANAGNSLIDGMMNVFVGSGSGGTMSSSTNCIVVGSPSTMSNTSDNRIIIGMNTEDTGVDNSWLIGTLGCKQFIKEGADAAMGSDTLVGGTVTILNALVTANSRIFLTSQDDNGGVAGAIRVSARTPGVSFVITSTSVTDTSIVAYEIKEPVL